MARNSVYRPPSALFLYKLLHQVSRIMHYQIAEGQDNQDRGTYKALTSSSSLPNYSRCCSIGRARGYPNLSRGHGSWRTAMVLPTSTPVHLQRRGFIGTSRTLSSHISVSKVRSFL